MSRAGPAHCATAVHQIYNIFNFTLPNETIFLRDVKIVQREFGLDIIFLIYYYIIIYYFSSKLTHWPYLPLLRSLVLNISFRKGLVESQIMMSSESHLWCEEITCKRSECYSQWIIFVLQMKIFDKNKDGCLDLNDLARYDAASCLRLILLYQFLVKLPEGFCQKCTWRYIRHCLYLTLYCT